jgi:predicted acyltransferase
MYELLRASLPEFFGSLGAALVLTASAWAAAHLRRRRARQRPSEMDED